MSQTDTQISSVAGIDIFARLQEAMGSVIRGKDGVIRLALVTLFAEGHLLIEDVPGVGKTTLARALACSLACAFQRIQFTSDMMPSDVTGVSIFNPHSQRFEFRPGPIFANIILADEINRTSPKTQSALLEAMNEFQVTVDERTHLLPRPFMVVATQNPVEHHGTFPIPESQRDRFLMRIEIGYPSRESEKEILRSSSGLDPLLETEPVMTGEEVAEVQERVRQVSVDDDLVAYLLAIVEKTRQHAQLGLGVSPRGSRSLYRAAQSMALLEGRSYCLPDDFKRLAVPVLAHRCVVSPQHVSSIGKGRQAKAIIEEILEQTPVPL